MGYALEKNRGSRRRIKLTLCFLAVLFLYAMYSFFQTMGRIDDKQLQILTLQKQLDTYRSTHSTYKEEIRRLNDPEYIMQRDRKLFHMTRENEIPFILQGDAQ
jgi:cell division protein FtsB